MDKNLAIFYQQSSSFECVHERTLHRHKRSIHLRITESLDKET